MASRAQHTIRALVGREYISESAPHGTKEVSHGATAGELLHKRANVFPGDSEDTVKGCGTPMIGASTTSDTTVPPGYGGETGSVWSPI